jgi:hypothetical protein
MTEYVITEVSLRQWLVFADRKCIASCADEVGAEKAMYEHSARGSRSNVRMTSGADQTGSTSVFSNERPAG